MFVALRFGCRFLFTFIQLLGPHFPPSIPEEPQCILINANTPWMSCVVICIHSAFSRHSGLYSSHILNDSPDSLDSLIFKPARFSSPHLSKHSLLWFDSSIALIIVVSFLYPHFPTACDISLNLSHPLPAVKTINHTPSPGESNLYQWLIVV